MVKVRELSLFVVTLYNPIDATEYAIGIFKDKELAYSLRDSKRANKHNKDYEFFVERVTVDTDL